MYMREKGKCFAGGIKKWHGSEIENSSMRILITLADLEVAVVLVEERSNTALSQQLKSPPKIRKCEDISGKSEKSCLKNSGLSQLGAYTFISRTGVL